MSERQNHFDNIKKAMQGIRNEVARKRAEKALKSVDRKAGNNVVTGENKQGTARLKQELMDISVNPPELCSARLENDDLYHWVATINGPPDSVYSGGVFHLDFHFPKVYPLKPPAVSILS